MSNAITRKQRNAIKNLAGIVKISAREVEVFIEDGDSGRADYDATEAARVAACEVLSGWGGYQSGFGSWVLRPDYEPAGDWNDKNSAWHY